MHRPVIYQDHGFADKHPLQWRSGAGSGIPGTCLIWHSGLIPQPGKQRSTLPITDTIARAGKDIIARDHSGPRKEKAPGV